MIAQASSALDEHLTEEENEILPIVAEHLSPAEWAADAAPGRLRPDWQTRGMRVVGLMSGTSYDGIDVAVADLAIEGAEVVLRPLGSLDRPHSSEVVALLSGMLPPSSTTLADVCRLDTLLGQAFAAAAAAGVSLAGGADLVVSHGQTVYHWVSGGSVLGTLQLGQPAWIAASTGLPVVSDLRARDITVGGQGAPLVSILDALLLPPSSSPRAALNLGGIANLTVIPPSGEPFAYDVGPANALIDLCARSLLGEPFDRLGAHARTGVVDESWLARLLDHPYFDQPAPKSTGKELFHAGFLGSLPALSADDVLATVTELTARTIANDLAKHAITEVVPSGGGVRNPFLMSRLAALSPGVTFRPIDSFGLPSDAKEAYLFALLGFLTFHGLPATVPSCTGASAPSLLGSITPGASPLRLPTPSPAMPRRLRVVAD